VSAQSDFGSSGTPSTMVQSGSSIVITLGTPAGAPQTEVVANTMVWTLASTATDPAGNTCTGADGNEAAPSDVDF